MLRNSLLKTGAISEVYVTSTGFKYGIKSNVWYRYALTTELDHLTKLNVKNLNVYFKIRSILFEKKIIMLIKTFFKGKINDFNFTF